MYGSLRERQGVEDVNNKLSGFLSGRVKTVLLNLAHRVDPFITPTVLNIDVQEIKARLILSGIFIDYFIHDSMRMSPEHYFEEY